MIKKEFNLIIFSLIFFLFYNSCEKDDICLSDTPSSPRLIVRMVDKDDPTLYKLANDLLIKVVDNDSINIKSSDSIILNLNPYKNYTQFEFILNQGSENQNIDTLQINYSLNNIYIDRACGYKTSFIFNSNALTLINEKNNWIESYLILKDTIINEEQAHMAILH
ncbi:MAG: DUF6452 family protein [Flavobacteriaceae bacterium]|tara:strand:+ start:113 stop:607 length:495 start_codon:yes stop_codon:yes gene_type:complete